jgi:osmotically-inducible protein OsmY
VTAPLNIERFAVNPMRIPSIASVAGVLLLYGCTTIGTNSGTASNSEIEQTIKTQLYSDPQLQGVAVDAKADKNEVTLSGTVTTEDLRTKAIDIAKNGRPNWVVTDKIDVNPREVARSEYTEDMGRIAREKAKELGDRIGKSVDDAWIHTKIAAKLIDNPATPSRKINIDVVDNVVHCAAKWIAVPQRMRRNERQNKPRGSSESTICCRSDPSAAVANLRSSMPKMTRRSGSRPGGAKNPAESKTTSQAWRATGNLAQNESRIHSVPRCLSLLVIFLLTSSLGLLTCPMFCTSPTERV